MLVNAKPMNKSFFVPDHKLIVTLATDKFDEVFKFEKSKLKQFLDDLSETVGECKAIRKALSRYNITDTGPRNMYSMEGNPT